MSTTVVPLGNLRFLAMNVLACCTELPNGLFQLLFLELLQIVHAPAIKSVGPEFLQPDHRSHNHTNAGVPLPRLQELTFDGLLEWEVWEWEEHLKAMPILENLRLEKCKLRCMPPGLAFHAKALKKLYIYDVKHLRSLENFNSVVHLDVRTNTDLERISNLPKLQKLVIVKCPKLKVLEGIPALQRLELEDFDLETVPGYMKDVKPRHLFLYCSLSLLTCIAAGKSGPEWNKFSHIQQVKAYAADEGIPRKRYVLYTRDPFHFETNISRSTIAQGELINDALHPVYFIFGYTILLVACVKRTWFPYSKTCPIEDEWSVGRDASADKRLPLCLRFRCNAYRHLIPWLRQACLHCSEAARIASSSDQWIEAAGHRAAWRYETTYGRLQRQKETS